MFNEQSILAFLDDALERSEMPEFGNMNIDYISSQLTAYRSSDKWLLIFNSVVWWPAVEGLMTIVETVGTGVTGKQGFDDDHAFTPAQYKLDDSEENILSISIRSESINPESLNIDPNYEYNPDYEFWVSVALTEQHKDKLLANHEEMARFIPSDYQHLITLDEWDHPTWEIPASQTETFPRLAEVLVSSDSSRWRPVQTPNTHWARWLPK